MGKTIHITYTFTDTKWKRLTEKHSERSIRHLLHLGGLQKILPLFRESDGAIRFSLISSTQDTDPKTETWRRD